MVFLVGFMSLCDHNCDYAKLLLQVNHHMMSNTNNSAHKLPGEMLQQTNYFIKLFPKQSAPCSII